MRPSLRHRRLAPLAITAVLLVPACSGDSAGTTSTAAGTAGSSTESSVTDGTPTDDDTAANGDGATGSGSSSDETAADDERAVLDASAADTGMLDSTAVHQISVEFDDADYAAMIEAYATTDAKEWISATVTIDGVTYENVGLRLKGNSSLRGVSTDSAPEQLPWLIRFDKYVDGQRYGDVEDLVIRSNTTTTSLNEAVALDLLELAGLASQDAMATGFSVNGSDAVLRLAIEHPDGEWVDTWFGTDGSLYKAEATGDYSYRGDDAAAYDEVFDLEAGDDETLTHLTAFLRFINESDDATFAAELADQLDVESFARYLAMMDLISNTDDIDGPGNNSYLYYDPSTDQLTVVPWDMNLAFGGFGGGGMGGPGGGQMPGGDRPGGGRSRDAGADGSLPEGFPTDGSLPEGFPTDGSLPEGFPADGSFPGGGGTGGGRGIGFGGSNVLVERFTSNETFATLYDEALAELQTQLFDSGVADEVLARWVDLLQAEAADLVDASTITEEAEAVANRFPG